MLSCITHRVCYAQGENNVWMFGQNYSLDFNQNPPLLRDDVYLNGTPYGSTSQSPMPITLNKYNYGQAVCDENGNILFMVKSYVFTSGMPAPSIFDRDEVPIEGTEFLMANDFQHCRPVVIPHPGNTKQYYIFYVRNGGLIYCLFDLSLNNGRGDIVPGYKNILHFAYNNIVSGKLVSVQGCDGVWLITRHRIHNQYLSFKIDINGLASSPVTSEVGQMLPDSYYGDIFDLVASPNGKMLATVVNNGNLNNLVGGTELYDFEKCSGKVKNARFLDPGSSFSYGVGFSPDNSKLYVAYSEYNASYAWMSSENREHKLYQFDLSLGNIADIENSKTLIFTNPTINAWEPFCPLNTPMIGTMRIGPDGKLYMTNGAKQVCPSTGGMALAIHAINNPNIQGLACNPSINQIYNSQNGMSNAFILSRVNFPTEIIKASAGLPDTVVNDKFELDVCFKADTSLKVPAGVGCIEWSTGQTDTSIIVIQPGVYWVRYVKDCTVYIDTFDVDFTLMPQIDYVQYGCPGYITLNAGYIGGKSFELELYNSLGGKIYGGGNQSLHQVFNLDEGQYTLKIKSAGADCDTTIEVELKEYPLPDIAITPTFAEITYGAEVLLKAEGAMTYIWSPAGSLNTRTSNEVIARPEEDTRYSVVGINDYGCRDTTYALVKVNYNKNIRVPSAFTPNGDGLNDLFQILGGAYTVRKFEVYNRYAQIVYRDNGNNTGWDGRYNGKNCDAGVYYYIIQVDFPDGTNTLLKGDLSLIR